MQFLEQCSSYSRKKKGRKLPTEETSDLTYLSSWCRKSSREDILEELLWKEEN